MNLKVNLLVCALLSAVIISSVNAVNVSCLTSLPMTSPYKLCNVNNYNEPSAVVTKISAEKDVSCIKGVNYDFLYYGPAETYVWVTISCGGTFQVTSNTWTSWGAWGTCSVTCGVGSQIRTRKCPIGAVCGKGSASMSKSCTKPACGSIISWNAWGGWTACSKTCGVGLSIRKRTCSVSSIYSCMSIGGSILGTRQCNLQECSVDVVPSFTTANNPMCGKSNEFGYRILGGSAATNCEYPWMVMIYNWFKRKICGGTIIDSTHILTAGHCMYFNDTGSTPANHLLVMTGSSTMPLLTFIPSVFKRTVARVKIHENFDPSYFDNDIAILTLTSPIVFNACHRPICLPPQGQSALGLGGCKVMGWGKTSNAKTAPVSPRLLQANIKVDTDATCKALYRKYYNKNIKLCGGGGGRGSCEGDSGGPLLCPDANGRYYQYAIVSAGTNDKCGIDQGFYTKLTSYIDWIRNNTK